MCILTLKGYPAIRKALVDDTFHIHFTRPPSFNGTQEDWDRVCIWALDMQEFNGFTQEAAKRYGISTPSYSKPILIMDEKGAILILEFDTRDKGRLPIWILDTYFPFLTYELLRLCEYMLSKVGIGLTLEGRPDNIVPLTHHKDLDSLLRSMSSRVGRTLKKGVRFPLHCSVISLDRFINLMQNDEGKKLQAETTMHHLCGLYPGNIENPEYFKRSLHGVTGCVDIQPYLDSLRFIGCKLLAHYYGSEVIALSLIHIKRDSLPFEDSIMYWVGSWIKQSGTAYRLRTEEKLNVLYWVLIDLLSYAKDLRAYSLNIGLSLYPYKKDFSTTLEYFEGMEFN